MCMYIHPHTTHTQDDFHQTSRAGSKRGRIGSQRSVRGEMNMHAFGCGCGCAFHLGKRLFKVSFTFVSVKRVLGCISTEILPATSIPPVHTGLAVRQSGVSELFRSIVLGQQRSFPIYLHKCQLHLYEHSQVCCIHMCKVCGLSSL